jgi:hypothetical protein
MTWVQPVLLQGSRASLIPLTQSHANDLVEAVSDGELWKLWYTSIPTPDKIASFIEPAACCASKGHLSSFCRSRQCNRQGRRHDELFEHRAGSPPTRDRRDLVSQENPAVPSQYGMQTSTPWSCLQRAALHRDRVSNALFQLSEPSRNREIGRKTGRCTAQPSNS